MCVHTCLKGHLPTAPQHAGTISSSTSSQSSACPTGNLFSTYPHPAPTILIFTLTLICPGVRFLGSPAEDGLAPKNQAETGLFLCLPIFPKTFSEKAQHQRTMCSNFHHRRPMFSNIHLRRPMFSNFSGLFASASSTEGPCAPEEHAAPRNEPLLRVSSELSPFQRCSLPHSMIHCTTKLCVSDSQTIPLTSQSGIFFRVLSESDSSEILQHDSPEFGLQC